MIIWHFSRLLTFPVTTLFPETTMGLPERESDNKVDEWQWNMGATKYGKCKSVTMNKKMRLTIDWREYDDWRKCDET